MMTGNEMVFTYFFPLGYDVEADFSAVAAARIEFAAFRRIDRTRNVALKRDHLASIVNPSWNGAHRRVRMSRVLERSSVGANSTMLPRYMTATRSDMYLMTDKSCVNKYVGSYRPSNHSQIDDLGLDQASR